MEREDEDEDDMEDDGNFTALYETNEPSALSLHLPLDAFPHSCLICLCYCYFCLSPPLAAAALPTAHCYSHVISLVALHWRKRYIGGFVSGFVLAALSGCSPRGRLPSPNTARCPSAPPM